jgi:hypothetical protein
MMAQPTPPKLRPTADFLLEQIRELEQRLAQSRKSVLLLAAEMRHMRATSLILLYKAITDIACGRLDARELQEMVAAFAVSDPHPVDVVAAALAAARVVIIAAYGRKRAQQRCRCADGRHVAAWAVEVVEKGVKTQCVS